MLNCTVPSKISLDFSDVSVAICHILRMGILYGKPSGVSFVSRAVRTSVEPDDGRYEDSHCDIDDEIHPLKNP